MNKDINIIVELFRLNKLDEAEIKCIELLEFAPNDLFLLNLHGVILVKKDFQDKAINEFNKIIKINPESCEAYYNIGTVLFKQSKFNEAISYFNNAIKIKKDYFEAYFNLAECYKNLNLFDMAISIFETCLKYKPDDFEIYNNLGLIYQKINQFDFAVSNYQKALKINPDFFQVYNNLGALYMEAGRIDDAIIVLNKCIQINREFVSAYNNLGMALNIKRKYSSAALILEQGLKLNENSSDIISNLANSYKQSGDIFKAISFLEQEVLNNKTSKILKSLGDNWCSVGEILKGIKFYKESIELDPNNLSAYDSYVFNLNYLENFNIQEYFFITQKISSILKRYNKEEFKEIIALDSKKSKIRIGFVTADFREHAVGYQVFDVIKYLSENSELELYAYYNDNEEDDLTKKFKKFFKSWTKIILMDDLSVIKNIKADNLDILIDLSGHTSGNRLGIFINKPALIQISWAGYLASTGFNEIDYIIADKNSVTLDEEYQFKEKIWRMKNTWTILSKQDNIEVNYQIPSIKNQYLTFGSFNNIKKINKTVIDIWSKILCNSNSKLFLKTKELENDVFRERFKGYFLINGVKEEQLIFEGFSDRYELLKKYNSIDLALDPFPYNGGTTSLECSWMCVPILTKKGKSFLSKCGESINLSLGLEELIANDADEYILKAINYSKDINKIQKIKEYLIKNRNNFKLFNGKDFADELSNSFKAMLSLNKS